MNIPTVGETERFRVKVKSGDPNDCWNWTASLDGRGYGQFVRDDKTHVVSSRFAFLLHKGEFPAHLNVCHKCDNRKCCNPNHLFLATQKENLIDMDMKGRRNPAFGERNCRSRLSEDDVVLIRRMHSELGLGCRKISKIMAAGHVHIHKIITRKLWPNVHTN